MPPLRLSSRRRHFILGSETQICTRCAALERATIYFQDPDGILLEFSCWTRELTADDVAHEPAGEARPLAFPASR